MALQKTIKAVMRRGEDGYFVTECVAINVVTQGKTLDEVASNLKEAVELFLKDENPEDFGLTNRPALLVTFELEPEYA